MKPKDLWTKKRKGCADIHIHKALTHAVVDTNGFGVNAGISFEGHYFQSVGAAKAWAENNGERK